MKYIDLSKFGKNRGLYKAIVDDEDFDWLNQWNWALSFKNGYAVRRENDKTIFMHRFILNPIYLLETDHINGNRLDNRRENLRMVTRQQNTFNKSGNKRNVTSKFKGVYWEKNYWRALIKTIKLGKFKTQEEAAKAYDKKAKELFGEFARLNF